MAVNLKLKDNATEQEELDHLDVFVCNKIKKHLNEFNAQSRFVKVSGFKLEKGASHPTNAKMWWQFWKRK